MESHLNRFGSFLIVIILSICFFSIHGFFSNMKSGIINGDGLGYYSYLPSIFIYDDPKQEFIQEKYSEHYNNPEAPVYMQVIDNKSVNKYFLGTAFLMSPFFLIAHLLSQLLNQPADGFTILYQYIIGLSSIFYIFIGLYFLGRLLRLYHANTLQILFIKILVVFGTNLFIMGTTEVTMSHAFSFSMIAGFLFYSKSIFEFNKAKHIIPLFLTLALIILIRPLNFMIVLALPFLAGNIQKLTRGFRFILRHYFLTLAGVLFAFIIISLQFLVWYKQTGHFIVYSYSTERFYFDKPNIIKALFSYHRGFFIYTPTFFLSLIGFIYLFRKNKFSAISLFTFLFFIVYVISSWHNWYYGGGFGYRPLIDYYALLSLLLLFSLNLFKQRKGKIIFIVLCTFTLLLNQVQAYQYRNSILHWNGMTRNKYWQVFLRTDVRWKFYIWDNPDQSEIHGRTVSTYFTDFEKSQNGWHGKSVLNIANKAHSGNFVAILDNKTEYSNTLIITDNSDL